VHQEEVTLWFTELGKPSEYIEQFNGCLRDECLNENCFLKLAHARAFIEAWCCNTKSSD